MDLLAVLVIPVTLAAVGFYALFHVIRAAVLSALRKRDDEIASSRIPQTNSYLDADGL